MDPFGRDREGLNTARAKPGRFLGNKFLGFGGRRIFGNLCGLLFFFSHFVTPNHRFLKYRRLSHNFQFLTATPIAMQYAQSQA